MGDLPIPSVDVYWQEFTHPLWRYASIANLANFESDAEEIRFPDGLIIRSRNRGALVRAGWTPEELDRTIADDWMEGHGAHGSFVMMIEDSLPKTPDHIAYGSTGHEGERMARLLQALRLHGPGDVGLGTTYSHRVEPFPIGIGGYSRSLSGNTQMFSPPLVLTETDRPVVAQRYDQLSALGAQHASNLGHVAIALSRFGSAYDRPWFNSADRLIDDAIALEALVGTSGPELTYTLATRVSGLLSENDAQRVGMFERVRSFYGTRSRLVHGETLKARHQSDVQHEPEFRDIVRRLLRGFLNLTASDSFYPSRKFVDGLDVLLLDASARDTLRRAMNPGPAAEIAPTAGLSRITPLWTDQPPSSAEVIVGGSGS